VWRAARCFLTLFTCRAYGWAARFRANFCLRQFDLFPVISSLQKNCQAGCISCDYWKSRWQDRISTDRAVELVNEIGAAGIGTLRLTGGEPLLRRDLFEILEKANAASFKHIILQTNGLLLKKLHKEVNDSPITKVAVSIDGLKESNDLIRGIQGYFDLGIEGLRLLRNKKIAFSVTLNRLSAEELEKTCRRGSRVGC